MTSSQPSNPELITSTKGIYRKMPRSIWALGFVSMFMDISSELVHSLLPIFMGTVLGASMATIGIVEGVAEGAAAITKVFSGAISDYFGKRKFLAVLGYALSAMTKPIFPLATTIG
jgi:sugar phosphate permease